MNRDDVIRIAAGIWNAGSYFPIPSSDDLERFAELVTAAEREACAKLCEEMPDSWRQDFDDGCKACAKEIRARGNP